MSTGSEIDGSFLGSLESATLALETGTIPLLVFAGANSRRFVSQVSAALGATVIYVSQKDFDAQFRASLKREDTLFLLIDQPLAGQSLDLVNGYLAARDVMGADNAKLAKLGIAAPLKTHRLMLLIEKPVFAKHDRATQHHLAEFCQVIGVA
jgi:hypothetical protein